MNLGSRLKQILDERGLTVTRFSKEAGISAQTVYALINRDSNKADMHILMKVLAALNMDFFTFMGTEAPTCAASDTSAAVPTSAPDGKAALYINSDTYDKILELAADEGITDEAVILKVIEEYRELGFGYHQRPLRSILRDFKPKTGRSGDMDSFLL